MKNVSNGHKVIGKSEYVIGLLIILFALFISPFGAQASQPPELLRKAVEYAKAVEGNRISDYRLVDQDEKKFSLSDYSGKPLLVSFIYTTCPDICSSVVATLVPAIEAVRRTLGDEFNAIVVGFDAAYDTPEMMKEFGKHHGADFDLVRFASGDETTIDRMVRDFGFYYEPSEDGGFNHLGLVTVVDKDGFIYRQIYKSKLGEADLRVPLKQLLTGNIPAKKAPTVLDQIKSICLKYNPETGQYYIDYAYLFGLFLQFAVILFFAGWIFKDNILRFFSRLSKGQGVNSKDDKKHINEEVHDE